MLRRLSSSVRYRLRGTQANFRRDFRVVTSLSHPSTSKRLRAQTVKSEDVTDNLKLPTYEWDRGGRKESDVLTPLYASMKRLIDANQGCVCLIQVGSFYELYFEQAATYGPKLGLKVASRKTNNYVIPMAGFPTFQLQKFVKILVQDLGENVAIVDQCPSRRNQETIIHRKISRIVSPGTLVDETFLNYNQNNFLLAISFPANCTKVPADSETAVGLSWIDVSVGEFYIQNTTLGDLIADISRVNPSEIIISKEFQGDNIIDGNWFPPLQDLRKYFLRYHKTTYNDSKLKFKSGLQTTRKAIETYTVREEAAMNMILSYIDVNLPDSNPSLDLPITYWNKNCLQMDSRTREALELTERSTAGRSSVVGSLLTTIKRTVSPSGSRLLTQWLKSPILDIEELRKRQSFVTIFKDHHNLRTSLRYQVQQLGDFVRSLQRLAFGTGDNVTHLLAIADGLSKLEELKQFLVQECNSNPDGLKVLRRFLDDFQIPSEIASEIFSTLHIEMNEPLSDASQALDYEHEIGEEIEQLDEIEQQDGNIGVYDSKSIDKYKYIPKTTQDPVFSFSVRRDYNAILLSLHDSLDILKEKEDSMQIAVKDELTKIDPKLNISKKDQHGRFSNVLYISGKQKSIDEVYALLKDDIRDKRKASLIYKPVDWSKLQNLIEEKKEHIRELEKQIVEELRIKVLNQVSEIRRVSKMVDYLDITSSFAVLAEECNLVCPRFVKTPQLNIENGRHLVVESGLKSVGKMFTPNHTKITPNANLWVISGPNMGGKSTFLRQNAIIVILAQIGSFVPASKASIGVVDKIFTRIGASDDLFNDLSTFMVEMVETSNILKNATPRSLAIVDEIGRGTSGKEGLALAYATLFNLLQVNKSRTLFATHFGKELEQLLTSNKVNQKKIRYFRTRVIHKDEEEPSGLNLVIDHLLESGISERSFALEVAQMAGFPEEALCNAKKALKLLD
ncbi:muts domain V-domain-containing protein [Scheffersomyces xylosifermentans]|uniref:muts domain V-domain-containing protein n=1 Tax=Scheffersomyces xylosifermentans TaxID=1304137 RepID=UPI00315C5ADB